MRQQLINGTGADESLLEGAYNITSIRPSGWSADGRFLAYTLVGSFPLTSDVWVLPLFGDRKPFPLVQTEFLEDSTLDFQGLFGESGQSAAKI